MEIRKFNDKGIEHFRNYLAELRDGSTSPPPNDLLYNHDTSEPANGESQVENRTFSTRLELAKYLHNVFAGIEDDSLETDAHLWSWISLFYFEQLCPAQTNAIRRPGRDYRHILEPGYP